MKKKDYYNIAILSLITVLIGIYLIAKTALISKDGTLYINCAKQFATLNLVDAVRSIEVCPGYSFLIYLMHKVAGLFDHTESLQRWIVSAQVVSLLSKLIASIMLYFIGNYFTDRKTAFWGVIILSILPDSAEHGSDALTEWPHLAFLFTGILLLLLGNIYKKIWIFGLAGISAGIAFLIRSEGVQIIIYGTAWLIFNLIKPEGKLKRSQAITALVLMLIGFAILSVPYMKLTGYVFPDQNLIKISAQSNINSDSSTKYVYAGLPGISVAKIKGNKNIVKNICETLVYFFVPFLVTGVWFYYRKLKSIEQNFYISAFIILNITMLLVQQYHFHFISRRHTLALIAFTIFYIPLGLQIVSEWLAGKFNLNYKQIFYIFIFIGLIICTSKLYRFTTTQKTGYLVVSKWLENNTMKSAIIAVPDPRIFFYAEREGIVYDEKKKKKINSSNYIVKIIKNSEEEANTGLEEIYSVDVTKRKKDKLVIYKVVH